MNDQDIKDLQGQKLLALRTRLTQRLTLSGADSDETVKEEIDKLLEEDGRDTFRTLKQRRQLAQDLFQTVRRLDVLSELLADPEITEIMVNGPDRIFVEKHGRILPWEKSFSSRERLEDVIQQIVASCNRVVNTHSPLCDARLADGTRIHIALPPAALDGPVITMRRFPEKQMTMDELVEKESLTREAADFLQGLVTCGYAILVGGGTSAGKTTFLNALSSFIPLHERVITIEDTAELQLNGIPNLVRLEAKRANTGESESISLRDLIRAALRMRPDRIVVGEVRGAEAIDLLQAVNTGHEGSLSTAHANSPEDMILRLETMVLMGMELPLTAIRRQIAAGFDILIQLGRDHKGHRQVTRICEVMGCKDGEVLLETLYQRDETGRLACIHGLTHDEKWRKGHAL